MRRGKLIAGVVCLVVFALAGTSSASLLVYEGFNYAAGTDLTNGTLNAGTGLSGAWVTTDPDAGNYQVTSDTTAWGTLPQTGNRLHRISTGGVEAISRGVTADLDQASELWFSVLHDADATTQFAIGGSSFADGSSGSGNLASVPGFGFRATGNDTGTMGAQIWGNDGTRTANGATTDFGDGLLFLVGRVQFNAGVGGEDILSLYNVGTDLVLGTAFSTAQADVDETALNTLTMSSNRGPGFDEIRLGTTMEDVGVTVIPEPATLGLVAAFGGGILFIRRRFLMG